MGDDNFIGGGRPQTRLCVSLREAAELLGITVEAVRGRIERGTIETEQGPNNSVYVYLDADQLRQANTRSTDQSLLVEHLDNEVKFLREELQRKDAILTNIIHALRAPPSSTLEEFAQKAPQAPESATARTADRTTSQQTDDEGAQVSLRLSETKPVRPMHERIILMAQVWLAVLLAGTLPVTLTLVTVAVTNARRDNVFSPLIIYLLFHFFPLVCGLWAGFVWQKIQLRGYVFLGLLAGLIEVAVFVLFTAFPSIPSAISGGGAGYEVTPSDAIVVLATVTLFIAGGLFGDLLQWVRAPRALRPPGAWATLLIQATGAAVIGLIANVASAAVKAV